MVYSRWIAIKYPVGMPDVKHQPGSKFDYGGRLPLDMAACMRNSVVLLLVTISFLSNPVNLSHAFLFDTTTHPRSGRQGECGENLHHRPNAFPLNFKKTHLDSELDPIPFLVLFPILFFIPLSASAIDIPIQMNGPDPRYFISGGLCASISHGITTPIDVVKTRIQSEPEKYQGKGVFEAAKNILHNDGYEALLKGFGPTVIGYGLEGAAKFGLYESVKPTIVGLLHADNPNTAYIIASVLAGGVASIILCPLERTRIRLVTDPGFSKYNLLTGIPRLIEESGAASLFYGLPAMLSKQCPYTLGKQVTYDVIGPALYSIVGSANDVSTKTEVSFVAAFCASIVACILSQPGDVILTETYKNKSRLSISRSFSEVVGKIYDERQGMGGFYSGILARFIQVGGIITSQLLLYDFIKQSLGLSATVSS